MICMACKRRLRSPESIRVGYGPTCFERMFGKRLKRKRKKKAGSSDDIPGQMNIMDFLGK